MWIAYSYSLYFSDQFSCIKFFNPSYGLKDIDFQSLNHFKSFSGILLLLNSNIIQNSAGVDWSTDMWDPHVSLTVIKAFNLI